MATVVTETPRYGYLNDAPASGTDASIGAVLSQILHTGDIVTRAESVFLAKHGLNQARWVILMLLNDAEEGSLRSSDLAEKATVSRATITGLLNTMERAGLIVRAPDPHDRRSSRVKITSQGEELLEKVRPLFFQWAEETLSRLTPAERDSLILLLQKTQRKSRNGIRSSRMSTLS